MLEQTAIQRYQPQILDLALRQKHPIERVASYRLGVHNGERMMLVDRYDLNA
jgi:hypothetical protein